MSTKAFDSALDFMPEAKPTKTGLVASIEAFFSAMAEGMEMARRYQILTDRGVAPAEAATAAMKVAKR